MIYDERNFKAERSLNFGEMFQPLFAGVAMIVLTNRAIIETLLAVSKRKPWANAVRVSVSQRIMSAVLTQLMRKLIILVFIAIAKEVTPMSTKASFLRLLEAVIFENFHGIEPSERIVFRAKFVSHTIQIM